MRRPLMAVCMCFVTVVAVLLLSGRLDVGADTAGKCGAEAGSTAGKCGAEAGSAAWKCGAEAGSAAGKCGAEAGSTAGKSSEEVACLLPGMMALDGSKVIVTGHVYRKDTKYFYLDSVLLQNQAAGQQQIFSLSDNLICEYEEEAPLIGSLAEVRGTFRCFQGATNPGEFDNAKYYHAMGICGKLQYISLVSQGNDYSVWQEVLFELRQYFRNRLYYIFPEKEASIMSAMLLGDKSELDDEIKDLYQNNGIIHILSISGLHISIIGMSIYKLLRRIGVPVWMAAPLGGIVLLFYGIMTGMSISACRAIGMFLIRMLGEIVGRTYDMLTAVAIMAAGMIGWNPLNLENAGFLLSFGSILGIGVVYPALVDEKASKLKQSILSGVSITLTTLPIQLWFYYEIPTYSVFLNLLVLPFMTLVMLSGLIAMLTPGLGIVGTVDYIVLTAYEWLCRYFEKLPFARWNPGRPEIWQVVVYYGFLMLVLVLGRWRACMKDKTDAETGGNKQGRHENCAGKEIGTWKENIGKENVGKENVEKENTGKENVEKENVEKENTGKENVGKWYEDIVKNNIGKLKGHVLCVQGLMLTVAVMTLGINFPRPTIVTFLDVGQGDCICMQLASGEVYLFDCGSSSRSKIGEYVLKPFLKYHGISYIDAVFVSHPDEDHCNGIKELLANGAEWGITVGEVFLPDVTDGNTENEDVEPEKEVGVHDLEKVVMRSDSALHEPEEVMKSVESVAHEPEKVMESVESVVHEPEEVMLSAVGAARDDGLQEIVKVVASATQRRPITVRYIKAGDCWETEVCSFLCLHPSENSTITDANAYSQCFYVEWEQGMSLLLTGDVEEAGEEQLLQELQRRNIEDVTVLKVAHHGSRYSTKEELLEQINTAVAVISCGRNNTYGHPHAETLERLESNDATILTTPDYGAITMEIGKEIKVKNWYNCPSVSQPNEENR